MGARGVNDRLGDEPSPAIDGRATGQWLVKIRRLASASRRFRVLPARWLYPVAQIAILVLMVGALLWPATLDRTKLPAGFSMSDLMISHWPAALTLKRTVVQGQRLPLWNPYYGGGRPLAADPLAALFYPPTHLVHLLGVRDHFLLLMAGHLLLAGVGMLVLARVTLRLTQFSALVAALAFVATPRLVAHLGAGHLTMVQTVAWFPWAAAACWATVHDPGRWAVPLGGSLALLLLAGHPQLAYYGGLMVLGLSLWLLATRWRTAGRRAVLGPLAGLALAGVLAVSLASVHLLPLREFMAHSTRQRTVRVGDALALLPFFRALIGIRLPSAVPHEALFEPGLAVLALAVLGAVSWRRAGLPLLLGVAVVAGLALGVSSPVYQLAARLLPSFDRFRGLGRIWFVALVAIALLAGLGTETVMAWTRRFARRGATVAGVLCVVLVSATLLWAGRGLAHVEEVWTDTRPSQLDRNAALIVRTGLIDEEVQRGLRTSRMERPVAAGAGAGRIYGVQRNMRQLSAVMLNAELADGWDPLLIEPYVTFMQRAGGYIFRGYQLSVPPYEVYDPGYPTSREAQPNARLLGLLNVSVVLSRTPLTDPRFDLVSYVDGTFIYWNQAAAGYAYLVAPGPEGSPPTINSLRRLNASLRMRERSAERLSFTITSSTGGFLVLGSPAFPGWTARLDGQPVPLATIEGVLPAVRVEPGTHQLTYAYTPRTVYWGTVLSLGGTLVGLVWMVGFPRRRMSYEG